MINLIPKDEPYGSGLQGIFLKLYFYVQRGLGLLSEFHNLFIVIIGGYIALHLTSYVLLAAAFIGSIPILVLAGWFGVNRLSRFSEYYSVKFGSHYQLSTFEIIKNSRDLQKETNKQLKKIITLLEALPPKGSHHARTKARHTSTTKRNIRTRPHKNK